MDTTTTPVTDPALAAELIAGLAPYTEFVIRTERFGDIRLMARDIPRPGRRCTSLTHGTEWFDITAASLGDIGFVWMSNTGIV